MSDIPNSQRVRTICEMHSKEVIFGAAMIALHFAMRKPELCLAMQALPNSEGYELAYQILTTVLDKRGVGLNEIITGATL